jgi:ribosomal-protein-alanine N-acetyltransferase
MGFQEAVERIRAFGPCALAGTGACVAADRLDKSFELSTVRQPDALWVARLALRQPASRDVPVRCICAPPMPNCLVEKHLHEIVILPSADPAPLAALHAACFAQPGMRTRLPMLATPAHLRFTIQNGFVLARTAAGEAEILTLAVGRTRAGGGRCCVAISRAQAMGRNHCSWKWARQSHALALYARIGLCQGGAAKRYYARGRAGAQAFAASKFA